MGERCDGDGEGTRALPLNELRDRPGFKVAHLNVRSLVNKIEQLRMDLPESGLDVLTISESWLTPSTEDKLATIPKYDMIRLDRKTKHSNGQIKIGGGLCIFHKEALQVDQDRFVHLNESSNIIEMQWVVVTRPHTKKVLIVNVYRPPGGNLKEAFQKINDTMTVIPDLDKFEVLIMGDFNADANDDKLPPARIIKQFEAETTLQQVIVKTTRYSRKKNTTIDLAFTNMKHCTGSGTMNYNISDHKPIYILKKKIRNDETTTTKWARSYRGYNHDQLKATLLTYAPEQALQLNEPNECWNKLEQYITAAVNEHCPLHEIKIKNRPAPFITNELIELQNDRDHFTDKADQTGDQGDRFIANCLAKLAKKEVRKAKAKYFLDQAIKYNQNHKKFWYEYYKIQPKKTPTINNILDETTGEKITPEELPTRINNYFIDVGEKLAEKCPKIGDEEKIFTPLAKQINFTLKEIDRGQVEYRIQELAADKPSGLADIRSTFVKETMKIMAEEFTHLFNLVIKTGIFPDKWKVATVTPIPKVTNPKSCNELRPISILPLPGRIMEQIIHAEIKHYLEENNFFAKEQNGFRSQHSTTKALATILDQLLYNMDSARLSVSVFLDFKKAFDTIDHNILIQKLGMAGIDDVTCRLIKNYLTDRTQTTKINGHLSQTRTVKTGVPQGSTLGPLLFLIFINDLPLVSQEAEFIMFADDAVLTVHHESLHHAEKVMNSILKDIARWCAENKLTLNTKKTEYVIFGSKARKKREGEIQLKLGDEPLREVQSYKYLGTILDASLNVGPQIAKINSTLASKLTSFRKMRYCMSEATAAYIYKATILPIIDYNDIIYELMTNQQKTKLQRIQNRALRIVFQGKKMSVEEMHDKAKVQYLEQRRESHLLSLMFKRSFQPEYVESNARKTRQSEGRILAVPHPRTSKYKKAPLYCGSKMWNELPFKVRDTNSIVVFKNRVRTHLAILLDDTGPI